LTKLASATGMAVTPTANKESTTAKVALKFMVLVRLCYRWRVLSERIDVSPASQTVLM